MLLAGWAGPSKPGGNRPPVQYSHQIFAGIKGFIKCSSHLLSADFAGLSELAVRGTIVTRHPNFGKNKSKIFAPPDF